MKAYTAMKRRDLYTLEQEFRRPIVRENKHDLSRDIDEEINKMTNVEFLRALSEAMQSWMEETP